ncbi:MAG: nuclear transport factor 2 family protein [Burkholderiaceae bacterium]|nr:nuclear transport factor 2 family protein [Burkholderiaceae bacterium]
MARFPPSAIGSPDEAEAGFYEALQQGNIVRLMAAWADDDGIVCIHPGWPRLVGAAAIRDSYERIFAHGPVDVWPGDTLRWQAGSTAVHSVVERVGVLTPQGLHAVHVLATNVYLKTALGWRLVAHHASPGTAGEPAEAAPPSSAIH